MGLAVSQERHPKRCRTWRSGTSDFVAREIGPRWAVISLLGPVQASFVLGAARIIGEPEAAHIYAHADVDLPTNRITRVPKIDLHGCLDNGAEHDINFAETWTNIN